MIFELLTQAGGLLQPFVFADKKTDVAATILRMLYIKDLRGLQTIVDETLVNVQVHCMLLPCVSTCQYQVTAFPTCYAWCRTTQPILKQMQHLAVLAADLRE